jgi:excisionase family DNA binding protein
MAYLRKPPNSTDDDLRHIAAILSMIATAITRMADTAPGTSKSEGQNKKTMGASAPAPNGLPEHEILTVAEVAKYLRISKAQAYVLTRRGEIPTIRVGQSPRVRRQDLPKYLEDRMRYE